MKKIKLTLISVLLVIVAVFSLASCNTPESEGLNYKIEITGSEKFYLSVGEEAEIKTNATEEDAAWLTYSTSDASIACVDQFGFVTALSDGKAVITVVYSKNGETVGTVEIEIGGSVVPTPTPGPETDPYVGMSATEFYENYTPATSCKDAEWRSQHFFMSGSLTASEQMMTVSYYQPSYNGMLIHNSEARYEDNGNTYVVLDAYGNVKMRIYRGGAYITLEEVAAYMYAFGGTSGSIPANYTSKKSGKPSSSPWGEYLRCNHSYFSGDTDRYPYEPELPNISGCGGALQYYEMDIGTTGTVTPGYNSQIYNNGSKITRGAARIVYGREDLNRNGTFEQNEVYLFYTFNHYNDFTEYLNYYGGWGTVFGNVTGGGVFDSDTKCNPTPYVKTYRTQISSKTASECVYEIVCILPDIRKIYLAA